jgi:hypothetical protein
MIRPTAGSANIDPSTLLLVIFTIAPSFLVVRVITRA